MAGPALLSPKICSNNFNRIYASREGKILTTMLEKRPVEPSRSRQSPVAQWAKLFITELFVRKNVAGGIFNFPLSQCSFIMNLAIRVQKFTSCPTKAPNTGTTKINETKKMSIELLHSKPLFLQAC